MDGQTLSYTILGSNKRDQKITINELMSEITLEIIGDKIIGIDSQV